MDPASPFGGYKQSGIGREHGSESIDMYTETKSVWINDYQEPPCGCRVIKEAFFFIILKGARF